MVSFHVQKQKQKRNTLILHKCALVLYGITWPTNTIRLHLILTIFSSHFHVYIPISLSPLLFNKQTTIHLLELLVHLHCRASTLVLSPSSPSRFSSLGQLKNIYCAGYYSPSSASYTFSRHSAGCAAAPLSCFLPLGFPCLELPCLVSTGNCAISLLH